ncbi:MAG: glycine betaine ABC transporter substrate-binding protein [Cyanobacteria bacterium P01_G01_bin.54]
MFAFLQSRFSELILRIGEHLFLTGIAVGIAVMVGIPLGILIVNQPRLRALVFGLAGIVQTIPSLAMLAFLLTLIGKIGVVPAIIALTLYALLPIIQNTVTGLEGVPAAIQEAAQGMGMTRFQKIRWVTIPLALPVILSGVKTAAVISVGIATLSAFIGAGGLGEFINRGLSLVDNRLILLGSIPAALLALAVSFTITALAWGFDRRQRRQWPALSGNLGVFVSLIPLVLLLTLGSGGALYNQIQKTDAPILRVGSKSFTEQLIIAELMAQVIETATPIRVERKFNLGGTIICHDALVAGEIDLYAEYTGTGLLAVLKSDRRLSTADAVYDFVKAQYAEQFAVAWFEPFGFNNTFALAVRQQDSQQFNWQTISDLGASAQTIRAGVTPEFAERLDGYLGLQKAYGFSFANVKDLEQALLYDAMQNQQLDVMVAYGTDSKIKTYDLVLLKDNLNFFPPYYAAPIVRQDVLNQYPELEVALGSLAGRIDDETMRDLNYQVEQAKRPLETVVADFIHEQVDLPAGN